MSAWLAVATTHDGGLVGHEVVRAEKVTYPPQSSRPWGLRDGLHQVTVLTGTLTAEDGDGHGRDYHPGESYVAGWKPYVTRNVTASPVEVTVSYLVPAGQPDAADSYAPND